MNDFTNEKNIKNIYYDNSSKLQCRLDAWNKYGTNKINFFDWIAYQLPRLDYGHRFLDAGCGTGRLLSLLEKRYGKASFYGVDISPAMIRASKFLISKRNRQNVIEANIKKLPFPSNYFDAISITHVLYHVPDIPKAIGELKRVLKPTGVLFVTTTDYDLEQGLNRIHYKTLHKLHFPRFVQSKKKYLRFPPAYAFSVLKHYFSKVKICKFRNDLIYTDVDSCFDYYQTAMMYRNSKGMGDKRISEGLWERLAKEVRNEITKKIKQNGGLRIKGSVFGFKARKI